VWPVAWPEETEGERNEPCFEPESLAMIKAGVAWADGAAGELSAMPPNLEVAVGAIKAASQSWEGASGSDPGQAKLNEARATLDRPWVRVSTYVEPVGAMLESLRAGAMSVVGDAREAASAMTEPESADEKPEPCFEPGQQAEIGRAIRLATDAATELDKRPPDYGKAMTMLKNAYSLLHANGGLEPGNARLKAAVGTLGSLLDVVEAYLMPVATVVAEAAADLREASAQASEAADMAKPGPFRQPPPPG
jgi:hypothetical protein